MQPEDKTETKPPVKLIQGVFKLNNLDPSEDAMSEDVALKAIAEIKPFLTMGKVLGTYDLDTSRMDLQEGLKVSEEDAATKVTNIFCEGDFVVAEVELLSNDAGNALLADLKAGQNIALEAVGFAETTESGIVESYHFLTVNVAKL